MYTLIKIQHLAGQLRDSVASPHYASAALEHHPVDLVPNLLRIHASMHKSQDGARLFIDNFTSNLFGFKLL